MALPGQQQQPADMNPQSAQPMLWQADVLVRWRQREQVGEFT
jgi:hypothetical protein